MPGEYLFSPGLGGCACPVSGEYLFSLSWAGWVRMPDEYLFSLFHSQASAIRAAAC